MLMIRLNLEVFWSNRRRSILGTRLLDLQLLQQSFISRVFFFGFLIEKKKNQMLFKKKKIHDQNFPITFCQNPAIQILKNRKLTISELEVRNFFSVFVTLHINTGQYYYNKKKKRIASWTCTALSFLKSFQHFIGPWI